jgi:hypothetical protein
MTTAEAQGDLFSFFQDQVRKAVDQDVPEAEVSKAYDEVAAQPGGTDVLAALKTVQAHQNNKALAPIMKSFLPDILPDIKKLFVSEWSNEKPASGSVVNIQLYDRLQVNCEAIKKSINLNLGGVNIGFPGGALLYVFHFSHSHNQHSLTK